MPLEFDLSTIPCPWGLVPSLVSERYLHQHQYYAVAGLDEVGRGCLAGPVVAGAVILPLRDDIESALSGVRDSKQLSAGRRNVLVKDIQSIAIAWSVGVIDVDMIDSVNILQSTKLAMLQAIQKLSFPPDFLLLDALSLAQSPLPQFPIIKGDQRSLSIAAASIVAKVFRDNLMIEMEQQYPGYGFAQHKGYGTAQHIRALNALGPCSIHRRSFAPVRNILCTFPAEKEE